MSALTLLWLLLPVAAASGWWLGRRSLPGHSDGRQGDALEARYFKGINYLLNEQPDQAVDAFIELLEVGAETAETHLALGGLYRRRGEVDRAIRIHQNLVAQPELDAEHRSEALLELAQDYQSAGLLDRAEDLFKELADSGQHRVQALRQLIDIYEHESDWLRAIEVAQELQRVTGNQLGPVIAHYHCELAETHRRAGRTHEAFAQLDQAVQAHGASVRTSLLEGDIHAENGNHVEALAAYWRIEDQDAAFLNEAIPRISQCFGEVDDPRAASEFLAGLVYRDDDPDATLALSELKLMSEGAASASDFLLGQMRRRLSLRGLHRLLELLADAQVSVQGRDLDVLKDLTERLLAESPTYQCRHCGFPARSLHWQCPSCKHWSTMQPKSLPDGVST